MFSSARRKEDHVSSIRHRKLRDNSFDENDIKDQKVAKSLKSAAINQNTELESGTYWLTRIVFLRFQAFIYFVAYLVALHQNKELIGTKGLLPANLYMKRLSDHVNGNLWDGLNFGPTLLWFTEWKNVDYWLDSIAYAGLMLSGFIILTGCANMIMMAGLWILYHSLVNVGQRWYGFGWESQLLECGFLAIFMCPLFSLREIPRRTPTPLVTLLGFRWLIFRIMIGAGLIKIRGDQCWRDLTCMNYHYETQPVPNPVSYYLHQSPDWMHQFETASNHFIELGAPWLLIIPWRPTLMIGGTIQVLFQVVLILSGNLSFLNWLTILPSICCFDDKFFAKFFSKGVIAQVKEIQEESRSNIQQLHQGQYIRSVMHIALAALITYLSIPVVKNLLSQRQAMNTSFDPLRIVNTYGAFGSVTKERTEVIFQGTSSTNPTDPNAEWLEYEFKCKPGNVTRTPCLISPYHYRLDWLMWFAAFQSYQRNNWLVHLAGKLLANDEATVTLIEHNPFRDKDPPELRANFKF
ncbi:lipase maturation factor 1-like isoform X2 [Anneissia japonica]|uniref:lipase maturation factor 1-like isoform X2 n=1 Tax=Anneissia japonica TaxID=1529436 RepID=UPI001425BA08|nr:lipase maturation factor 1-like isoform X2 [Anneissia japonica]